MLRKVATILAMAGLSFALVGAGLGAVFTDGGVVTQTVTVGTFGFDLSSDTPGAVVSPDGASITYAAADIQSAAPGSAPLEFTVTSTGTIPIKISVSHSPMSGSWSSLLAEPIEDVILAQGESHTYNAGIQWVELTNDDLGTLVEITYSVSGSEV